MLKTGLFRSGCRARLFDNLLLTVRFEMTVYYYKLNYILIIL